MTRRRVVVTGMGALTALGRSFEECWERLLGGENGIGPIEAFDTSEFRTSIGGVIKGYTPAEHFSGPDTRKLDIFTQYALLATADCLQDSGIDLQALDLDRFGCILGSGIGGIVAIEAAQTTFLKRGPSRTSPHFIPKMMPNSMSAYVSIKHGLRGSNFVTASACASSGHALGMALRSIQYDESDLVLTGGSEGSITPLSVSAFSAMKALSTRNEEPELASRPFDKDRDGFVMGEGAATLLLEEREHALARGARIYAELQGYGSTADAFHITQPMETGVGPRRAMAQALEDGGVAPDRVDYVNAHGTSTHYNDIVETRAIRDLFGPQADRLAVSSTKSMIGHLLGASSAIEAAVTCRSIAEQKIHSTRNHGVPGEGCDLDYVPGECRDWPIRHAISNSLGFGGHNVCLLFGRHDG